MDAAIAKILSEDIDIDDPEKYDFAEGGSDSDAGEDSAEGSDLEEEDGGGADDGTEGDEDGEEEDDDDLDAGLTGPESDGDDGQEAISSEDGGSSGDDDDGSDRNAAAGKQVQRKSFLEGGKADTFARAFARIVDGTVPKAIGSEAPILAGSKSVAKRRAEDAVEAKADRAAKRLRQEMKQRGHVVPLRRGENPDADAREKALQKTATRGVVRLFNAVSKAQRRLKDADVGTGSRVKAAKLGKASFLTELRNAKEAAGSAEVLVPSSRGQPLGAAPGGDESESEGTAGWDVLKDGFTGLQGGSKMKDWDRQQSEEESPGGGGSSEGGDSGDDDGGW